MAADNAAKHKEQLMERIVEEATIEIKKLVQGFFEQGPSRLLEVEGKVREGMLQIGRGALEGILEGWGTGYAGQEVACACGGKKRFVGNRPRQPLSLVGPLSYRRSYYHCGTCGEGWAPRDAVLGLGRRNVTEGLQRCVSLLGSEETFVQAQEILQEVGGIDLSAKSLELVTMEIGEEVTEQAAEEHAALFALPSEEEPSQAVEARESGESRLYVTMDAFKVPTRQGWRDMKIAAIYTTEILPHLQAGGKLEAVAHQVSYVTGIEECEAFGRRVYAEAVRRGMTEATEVKCLGDGASWIWNQAELHFPESDQWIDWWHVTEWLWEVGKILYGEAKEETTNFARGLEALLWEGEVDAALAYLKRRRPSKEAHKEVLRKLTDRLQENRQRLPNYQQLHSQGYHIGSGVVESACKHVGQQRLKRAGMRWNKEHAEYVAQIRTHRLNGRWEEFWQRRYLRAA